MLRRTDVVSSGDGVAEVCEATHGCSLDTDFRPGRPESWLGSLLGRRLPPSQAEGAVLRRHPSRLTRPRSLSGRNKSSKLARRVRASPLSSTTNASGRDLSATKLRQYVRDKMLELLAGRELAARDAGLKCGLTLIGKAEHEIRCARLCERPDKVRCRLR
jgi:hypothetical protein